MGDGDSVGSRPGFQITGGVVTVEGGMAQGIGFLYEAAHQIIPVRCGLIFGVGERPEGVDPSTATGAAPAASVGQGGGGAKRIGDPGYRSLVIESIPSAVAVGVDQNRPVSRIVVCVAGDLPQRIGDACQAPHDVARTRGRS